MEHTSTTRFRTTQAIAWGAFLGCSWTWCIGMFLPGIMWRDYGIWGWIVFAIPNVLGAAAMGFVLKRREQSEAIVAQHRLACVVFSLVTIAFHGFWMAWFLRRVVDFSGLAMVLLIAGSTWGIARSRTRRAATLAVGIWLFSLAMLFIGAYRGMLDNPGVGLTINQAFLEQGLLWMTPAVCISFLLCPYLDLTFHQAAQHTDAPRRKLAFGLGFCVMFFTMIVFSLLYGRLQFSAFDTPGSPEFARFANLVSSHMIVQVGFTLGVHCLAVATIGSAKPSHPIGGMLCVGALLAGLLIGFFVNQFAGDPKLIGERVYICFLGAYGLAFPAYVWLFVMPHRWRERSTVASRRLVYVIVLVTCTPLFWFGFVERWTYMLIPGVLIPLLIRPLMSVNRRQIDT